VTRVVVMDARLCMTRLCPYGPEHRSAHVRDPCADCAPVPMFGEVIGPSSGSMWRPYGCSFAHSFVELMPPDERGSMLPEAWTGCYVDRWYGQNMSGQQLERIRFYSEGIEPCELPLWVRGLFWFDAFGDIVARGGLCPMTLMEACGAWDFDLHADQQMLCFRTVDSAMPFDVVDNFESAFARRAMLAESVRAAARAMREASNPDS